MKQVASGIPAGDRGTADRIEADEGAYWVRLVSRQALDREGDCMGHCVGDGDFDRLAGGEDLADDAIWSLRTPGGVSMLTVEVRDQVLLSARGRENHGPGRGASLQVRHLAAAFAAADRLFKVDEDTGIVLLDDGRTFRRDRLPPEIVAAREAAERARDAERAARRRGARAVARAVEQVVGSDFPTGQVIFRRAGSAAFEPIGDIGPFEIRFDEYDLRPIVDPDILHHRMHQAMQLTAGEEDPVVEAYMLPHARGQGFRTQSGIQFVVTAGEIIRGLLTGETYSLPGFMEAYRAAIARAAAARAPAPPAPIQTHFRMLGTAAVKVAFSQAAYLTASAVAAEPPS